MLVIFSSLPLHRRPHPPLSCRPTPGVTEPSLIITRPMGRPRHIRSNGLALALSSHYYWIVNVRVDRPGTLENATLVLQILVSLFHHFITIFNLASIYFFSNKFGTSVLVFAHHLQI